ncbi:MAG TPA: signal peptidase I [Candidatus Limnocylindrales bacterium]|nr:signal peptidase I [Candidatus Limnocylindrales bacterium]
MSRRPLGCLIEIAETLILTLIIFWVIQTFVAQPYRVEQSSMRATLEPEQYVLVDKLTPHFDDYSRGDIIVFNPAQRDAECSAEPDVPLDGVVPYIKRVIGQPGDKIEIRDGLVLVNGAALDEPYTLGSHTEPGDQSSWTVSADRLFVMGDNRTPGGSSDSRGMLGPICVRDVIGRAWLRYWPLDTLGILQTPTYPELPPGGDPAPAGEP